MRITVFGAAGNVGSRVVAEATDRGHEVTAVTRDPARLTALPEGVEARVGDASDADKVAELSAGQDVVITATRPVPGRESELVAATRSLLSGTARADVRLLLVGGAATLALPGGGGATVVDDPEFPPALRGIADACTEQLAACHADTRADWAYLSPAALLEPGERTGSYRLGGDELIVMENGDSRISMEDLAIVLLDEAERPKHHRVRFTAGY